MRLGQLMLEHHCLCLEPASSGKAIEEAVYDILHNHEEPYALAIDLGIIVEGGKRLGDDLKICFAHEQFTEYYFAEVLRSELDQILVPPYARAQMWAKHMVEHLANTHMIAVLSGAFVMLICKVTTKCILRYYLKS